MDIEIIKEQINDDKKRNSSSYKRYPVRFLFLDLDNDTQDTITELVRSYSGELLDLSEYLMKNEDGWMTKNRFMHIMKNKVSPDKDTFVTGFSELIRFFSKNEIESTVLSLFDIENSASDSTRRIFLICFSMMDDVKNVLGNSFSRKDLINPFINPNYEYVIGGKGVCFVSNEYANNIRTNKITTSAEWLGLWRLSTILDFSLPIWCCSSSLYDWHQKASPDNAFHIECVQNAKDYLEKSAGLYVDRPYRNEEASYWTELVSSCTEMSQPESLMEIIRNVFNLSSLSQDSLAAEYINAQSRYHKWLIRCFVETYYKDSFLQLIFDQVPTLSSTEFVKAIWKNGYYQKNPDMLQDRKLIINELQKYAEYSTPEEDIKEIICASLGFRDANSQIFDILDADVTLDIPLETEDEAISHLLHYYKSVFKSAYTGVSETEKEFLIALFARGVIDTSDIEEQYPLLYYYMLSDTKDEDDKWGTYVQEYKKSKLAFCDTAYIKEFYSTGCAREEAFYDAYYFYKNQDEYIDAYKEGADLYILDGVGAEYMEILKKLFDENGYDVAVSEYATCHLPSITEVNKQYIDRYNPKKWLQVFDQEVIHGEYYRTTRNIRKALTTLEKTIKRIVADADGTPIIITADHGATARARWTNPSKKYSFSNSNHEGRCCKIPDDNMEIEKTEDFTIYNDAATSASYIIALNDTSLYNKPRYEVHGGATVEEVLVPFLKAYPKENRRKTAYTITPGKTQVSGLDKLISFSINPIPSDKVVVVESSGDMQELDSANSEYKLYLSSGREQDITISVGGNKNILHITNKAKKNMGGDDGFDD